MDWCDPFDLVLFDFDGLLVDTERLHFRAYQAMCADHGVDLNWSFEQYCLTAHYTATAFREQLERDYPHLFESVEWSTLYQQKKRHLTQLFTSDTVHLMPGVVDVLKLLEEKNVRRCVVTHSAADLIAPVRASHPILDTIPHWITREDYHCPKPDPEPYQQAITRFGKEGDRIIGFEDSPRGIHALLGTSAHPVLICDRHHPGVKDALVSPRVQHFVDFSEFSRRSRPA
jgi:HAD superfamily hydrolase (TIGR01509 family)